MNSNPQFNPDEAREMAELEHQIYTEKLLSDEYIKKCAEDIRKWDRKELANLASHSIPYKLPFKVRFRNFINKLLNMI